MDRNDEIYKNLLELVGQTPMVQLNVITKDFPGNYFAKLEMFNPGQSQKDRIALHIVENAEKKGILKPGSTIVETTSGNTGFSLAMIFGVIFGTYSSIYIANTVLVRLRVSHKTIIKEEN